MAKEIVTVLWEDDETVTIMVNGKVVLGVDHDEHGWAGMRAAIGAATAVGRALGAVVETEGVPNA